MSVRSNRVPRSGWGVAPINGGAGPASPRPRPARARLPRRGRPPRGPPRVRGPRQCERRVRSHGLPDLRSNSRTAGVHASVPTDLRTSSALHRVASLPWSRYLMTAGSAGAPSALSVAAAWPLCWSTARNAATGSAVDGSLDDGQGLERLGDDEDVVVAEQGENGQGCYPGCPRRGPGAWHGDLREALGGVEDGLDGLGNLGTPGGVGRCPLEPPEGLPATPRPGRLEVVEGLTDEVAIGRAQGGRRSARSPRPGSCCRQPR